MHYCPGGLYWVCNLLLTQSASFVTVLLYTRAYFPLSPEDLAPESSQAGNDMPAPYHPIDPPLLWGVVAVLEGSFLLLFALFLLTIERRYIFTFFTTMTAKDFACQCFDLATTDEAKFYILKKHPSYHASRKQELRVWLASNWEKWTVTEKPSWFTGRLLASIPADLLPATITAETLNLRRRSIKELEGGEGAGALAVKEGVRRFSMQMAGERGGGRG